MRRSLLALLLAIIFGAQAPSAAAQATSGTLRGSVTDPSGGAVVGATVLLTDSAGKTTTGQTNKTGAYEFKNLPADTYGMTVGATGFALYQKDGVAIAAEQISNNRCAISHRSTKGKSRSHRLRIRTVDVNPSNNASALVLKGKDLDALSDDPDELQSELTALAGPSAGPMAAKSISTVSPAANSRPNPASAKSASIKIPSPPNSINSATAASKSSPSPAPINSTANFSSTPTIQPFNAQNPFVTTVPPYHTFLFSGNVSGPITKKASFFFDAERRNIGDASIVNAVVLDSNFNPTPFTAAISNPKTRTSISPRLDWQATKNNTITLRYRYVVSNNTNDLGTTASLRLALASLQFQHQRASRAGFRYLRHQRHHGQRNAHFQFTRDRERQTAQNFGTTISVPGAFVDGGNSKAIS